MPFVLFKIQTPRYECTADHHHTRTLTRSGPLSGGAGEVEGLGSVGFQKLIDICRTEASLLTNQEAAKGSNGHICPVNLQVHQQLLKHQQGLRQQREVVLPGSWGQSQQDLKSKTQWVMLTKILKYVTIHHRQICFIVRHLEVCASSWKLNQQINSAPFDTFTNLRSKMKSMDVTPACWRHLPLEMQGEVVSQEVTGSQARATVQGALTNV